MLKQKKLANVPSLGFGAVVSPGREVSPGASPPRASYGRKHPSPSFLSFHPARKPRRSCRSISVTESRHGTRSICSYSAFREPINRGVAAHLGEYEALVRGFFDDTITIENYITILNKEFRDITILECKANLLEGLFNLLMGETVSRLKSRQSSSLFTTIYGNSSLKAHRGTDLYSSS